ncbi:MAG: SRPBCC family protein [Deltaproteobacteria bacterium]|jgi:hypothetical protein|nr:SRPBCC family protein [Deltaproteobacteria bacterium]
MAKIFRSSVINAPIDEVWARIRDFNALPDWHPAFTDSHIENDEPGDKVGSIRNFNLKDGGNITLKLENRNWKFGLHAFVLFFPISTFQFQVSSRERLFINIRWN